MVALAVVLERRRAAAGRAGGRTAAEPCRHPARRCTTSASASASRLDASDGQAPTAGRVRRAAPGGAPSPWAPRCPANATRHRRPPWPGSPRWVMHWRSPSARCRPAHAARLPVVGLSTCAGFWKSFDQPDRLGLPPVPGWWWSPRVRSWRSPARWPPGPLRDSPWSCPPRPGATTRCPGSPFFVLVDGRIRPPHRRRGGQPVPPGRRDGAARRGRRPGFRDAGSRCRASPWASTGRRRELDNDRELLAAGIHPGDPSLYPARWRTSTGPVRPGAPAGPSRRPRPSAGRVERGNAAGPRHRGAAARRVRGAHLHPGLG